MTSASVLLPPARVDVYGLNKDTVESANSLVRDWRFSRVALRVENAGIDKAISDYEQHISPDLIIIEVDDIGDSFLTKLEQLAENCVEETDAIIIGPKNDVHLYRKLISMGVKDYLVTPASEDELGDVIATVLLDKKGLSESHIISVIGAKGGVGTTSIAQSIACEIADKLEQKTLLTDIAGGWGSLTIPFGAEITTTLQEIVRQAEAGADDDIKRLLHKDTEKLTLIPSGGGTMLENVCDENSLENMIDYFMRTYPVIVLDLSAAERDLQKIALKKSHDIVVVSSPLLPSLRNARSLIKEICESRKDSENKPHLVINMKGINTSIEVGLKEISEILEYEIDLDIQYDTKLFMNSEANEKVAVREKTAEKTAKLIEDFAKKLLPELSKLEKDSKTESKSGFLSKLLGK